MLKNPYDWRSVNPLNPPVHLDPIGLCHAQRAFLKAHAVQCNYANFTHSVFANRADHTAVASTASEASLLQGTKNQPKFDAGYFDQANGGWGKSVWIRCGGVFSNTGTPTLTFQVRLGTTVGDSFLTGSLVAQSAAITTSSGVTNVQWNLECFIHCNTPGQDTGNTTLSTYGRVWSPAGFASPFEYAMSPGGGASGTWTQTIANNLTQYVNVTATWSASSSSNTITLKSIDCVGWN